MHRSQQPDHGRRSAETGDLCRPVPGCAPSNSHSRSTTRVAGLARASAKAGNGARTTNQAVRRAVGMPARISGVSSAASSHRLVMSPAGSAARTKRRYPAAVLRPAASGSGGLPIARVQPACGLSGRRIAQDGLPDAGAGAVSSHGEVRPEPASEAQQGLEDVTSRDDPGQAPAPAGTPDKPHQHQ